MRKSYFIIALALIFAYGLTVRLFDLTMDPPAYFVGGAQDLTTDGPYLTIYARNAIEQGEWNPLGYEPWRQFKLSLISATAYLTYSTLGVSRFAANLTGVILSVLGLMLFLWGLGRYVSRPALVAAAGMLAASYLLVLFGRIPFAENGLICLSGLTFFVYSRWFDSLGGKIAVGVLIAMAALLGKSFGFLLLVAPLAYLICCDRKQLIPQGVYLVGTSLAVSILFSALFYQGSNLFAFLVEHGAGEHGNPYGFTSPIGYLETVISFARIGIHRFDPVMSILAYSFLVMLLLTPHLRDRAQDKVIAFLVGWLIIWIVGLAPFNYRPVRYILPMILPMAGLGALWLDSVLQPAHARPARVPWWRILLLLLLNWYAVFALANAFISDSMLVDVVRAEIWYSLPVAAVFTLITMFVARKQGIALPGGTRTTAVAVVLVLALVAQGRFLWPWWDDRTHTIDDANRDLPSVLGDDAVVAGQYGPAITEANGIQGFPLFVSPAEILDVAPVLKEYPVTHLAMGYMDWQALTQELPALKDVPVVAKYWLRDNIVYVVRIAGLFSVASIQRYQPGMLDQVLEHIEKGDNNAAFVGLQTLLTEYPDAKTPQIEFYHRTATPEHLQGLQPLVDTLVANHESDFSIHLLAAVYYKYLARFTSDASHTQTAEYHRDRAIALSPDNRSVVENGFRDYTPSDRIIR